MPEAAQIPDENKPSNSLRQWIGEIQLRPLHFLIGIVLSALFLWLAFRQVSLKQIGESLQDLDWGFITLSLMLSITGTLLRGARWQLLYYPEHQNVSFSRLTGLLFFSQMLNLLIPTRVGELARIAVMDPKQAPRTLGTIAVEKLLDLLTLLSFLLVLPLAIAPPDWFQSPSKSFLGLSLSLLAVSLLLFLFKGTLLKWAFSLLRILPHNWQKRLQKALDQALAGLDVFRSPWVGIRLQLWSFLVWSVGALTSFFLFRAFGLSLPFSAAIFLLLVLQFGIAVPSIPGKLGVFQYLVILALSAFGVQKQQTLSYSLLLYAVGFGPHILFGTLFGVREGIIKAESSKRQAERN